MKNSPATTGTPLTSSAVKVMFLGAGELGKEVMIEFQRYGVEVITVDRYDNAGVKGHSRNVSFSGLDETLSESDTQLRLFGTPEVKGERRMGVCLAKGSTIDDARQKANRVASKVKYILY